MSSTKHKVLFETVVGSTVHGTSTPQSDRDTNGVFVWDTDTYLSATVKNPYSDEIRKSDDNKVVEIGKFVAGLLDCNPSFLEMLNIPSKFWVCGMDENFMWFYENRKKFLLAKCVDTFGNYGAGEIRKAKGLNKKQNMTEVTRKDVLDFCHVIDKDFVGRPLRTFLNLRRVFITSKKGLSIVYGLEPIQHFKDGYNLYASSEIPYKGIADGYSNDVRISSIPKGEKPIGILSFNKDGYSQHCKKYKEYTDWLKNRNESRHADLQNNGQKYDGKNLGHCVRLINMAHDIFNFGEVIVERPESEYLLRIKQKYEDLETIIQNSTIKIEELDGLVKKSSLPEKHDPEFVVECWRRVLEIKKSNP